MERWTCACLGVTPAPAVAGIPKAQRVAVCVVSPRPAGHDGHTGRGRGEEAAVCLTGTFINATKDNAVLQAHGAVPRSHLSELVNRTGGPPFRRRARHAQPANGDHGREQDSSLLGEKTDTTQEGSSRLREG